MKKIGLYTIIVVCIVSVFINFMDVHNFRSSRNDYIDVIHRHLTSILSLLIVMADDSTQSFNKHAFETRGERLQDSLWVLATHDRSHNTLPNFLSTQRLIIHALHTREKSDLIEPLQLQIDVIKELIETISLNGELIQLDHFNFEINPNHSISTHRLFTAVNKANARSINIWRSLE